MPKTRHREVQYSNPMRRRIFVYSYCLPFWEFLFVFVFGSSTFVCFLFVLLMTTVDRRGRYYYQIYIIRMQYVEYRFCGPFKPGVLYMGIGKQNSTRCAACKLWLYS